MKPDRGTNVVSIAGTETKLAGSCNNNVVYIVYRQKKKLYIQFAPLDYTHYKYRTALNFNVTSRANCT